MSATHQIVGEELIALQAEQAARVTMKTSSPKADGGWATMEISLPLGATEAEITEAITQWARTAREAEFALAAFISETHAALPPERVRVQFLRGYPRGITLGELLNVDPGLLEWVATNGQEARIRDLARQVLDRANAGNAQPTNADVPPF